MLAQALKLRPSRYGVCIPAGSLLRWLVIDHLLVKANAEFAFFVTSRNHMNKQLFISLIAFVTFALCWNDPLKADEAYKLGPQDQLQIKVSDLRVGAGEAYQWQAFNGEFTVGPSGRVSLPIIGEIEASGYTTSDLEGVIAVKLQAKAGLAVKPDSSVQVIKFRPFYVLGSVDKPGEYEYRPQLSVLQAVSIAGGLQRSTTDALLGYVREALTYRGDIQGLSGGRLALIARQARIDAEIKDATLTFPSELQARIKEPEVERILREEKLLFESRRTGLQAQIANLNQTKDFLREQLTSLNAKDANTGRQLDVMKQELERVSNLVSKGLTALPRQVEAAQATAQLESNRLDAQIAAIRARQDISKADRDIIELKDTRRNSALQEATEIRVKLAEIEAKLEAAQNLLYQAEMGAPMAIVASNDAYGKPQYFIFRQIRGKSETIPASEDDRVQPGDVVRVQPKLPASSASRPPMGTTRLQRGLSPPNDF